MGRTSPKVSPSLRIAQALFLLGAVIWVCLAMWTMARAMCAGPGRAPGALVVGLLMLLNAAAFAGGGLFLRRRERCAYCGALTILVVNIILTFTDQVGLLDLVTLLLDVALVALLLAARGLRPLPRGDAREPS